MGELFILWIENKSIPFLDFSASIIIQDESWPRDTTTAAAARI